MLHGDMAWCQISHRCQCLAERSVTQSSRVAHLKRMKFKPQTPKLYNKVGYAQLQMLKGCYSSRCVRMSLVTMTTLSESGVNSWTSNTTSHNQIELCIGSSVLAGYSHLQFIHTKPSIESSPPPHLRCGSCCVVCALSSHMIFNQSDFCLRSHDRAVSTISACTISKVYSSCYKPLTIQVLHRLNKVHDAGWRSGASLHLI